MKLGGAAMDWCDKHLVTPSVINICFLIHHQGGGEGSSKRWRTMMAGEKGGDGVAVVDVR